AYVRYQIDSIRTQAAPTLTPQAKPSTSGPDSAGGLTPENILLIGNETRAGLTSPAEIAQFGSPTQFSGSLSDVIMVLHLNPSTDTASILSIPRDLFVPMPAGSPVGSYQKIDATLNDGANGAANLIAAIQNDLGIPINHYVEVDFDGFQATVNAIGGINVAFPEPLYDAYSLLNEPAGCQHLNGAQALALVRSRHLQYDPPGVNPNYPPSWPYDPESDLSRIVIDHTFLRILGQTAKNEAESNPLTANSLLSAVINQVTVDPGLKAQILTLFTHYHSLNVGTAPELTLPVTQVGGSSGYYYQGAAIGDVEFAVQPADNQVIAQWDGAALPTPQRPSGVTVVNISGTYSALQPAYSGLSAQGFTLTGESTGSDPGSPTETWVNYYPSQNGVSYALDVMQTLSGAVMLQPDSSLAQGTVEVDVGSLLAVPGLAANSAPPPASPNSSSSTTSSTSTSTTIGGSIRTGVSGNTTSTSSSTTSTSVGVPTPPGQTPSASADQLTPYDPRAC
ncbi:MAG: LCP family protein, partial [Acidimicrobiales bacterium]